MLVPRRYIRGSGVLLSLAVVGVLLYSNSPVVPFGKPEWAPPFGEPGPPTSREMPQKHRLPQNLTLHLLPHSHSDIGWNLSFQDYYASSVHAVMRRAAVELWKRADRRFTWGDLAFVHMWMADEGDKPNSVLPGDDSRLTWRQVLAELMRRGQWEFAGGTYVSPDEGLTTWWAHNSIVDLGHRVLARELNSSVGVAWQIDNFGHMDTMPYLLKNTGYEELILGRMAYRDLYDFASKSDLQFLWQSPKHAQLAEDAPLLTHFLSVHYASPSPSFDFDNSATCDVDQLLKELREFALKQVRQYPAHGQILVMMGDDFRYVEAARAFGCMDQLVDAAATRKEWQSIDIRYSTPSDYFAAIRPFLAQIDHRTTALNESTAADGPSELRLHQGDFFPYQDKPYEQYWSGMLTTRPYLKWLVRDTEQIVQHVESLLAASRIKKSVAPPRSSHTNSTKDYPMDKEMEAEKWSVLEQQMEYARQQVAIGYHHDAVTGTCTPGAFRDYVRRLKSASRVALLSGHYAIQVATPQFAQTSASEMKARLEAAQEEPRKMHRDLAVGYNTAAQRDEELADLGMAKRQRTHLEITREMCSPGESKCPGASVVVANANSLVGQDQIVRLRMHTLDAAIVDDATGHAVNDVQISREEDSGTFTVEFLARDIPAFGFKSYSVTGSGLGSESSTLSQLLGSHSVSSDRRGSAGRGHKPPRHRKRAVVLEKGQTQVKLSVSPDHRVRIAASLKGEPKEHVVWHQLRQYFANPRVQASGAYIMHSFMLMYALVFYIFGGSLCAGLAAAVIVHGESRVVSWFGFLRRLRVPDATALAGPWQGGSGRAKTSASEEDLAALADDRLSVYSDDSIGMDSGSATGSDRDSMLLVLEEDQKDAKSDAALGSGRYTGRWNADYSKAHAAQRPSVARRILAGAVPASIGASVGLAFTYFAEQVADIDMLTGWTVGDGVALRLAVPSFLAGYALAGGLRWSARRCALFVYGVSLSIALALFCLPTWQSRPLFDSSPRTEHGRRLMSFSLERGPLCDSAHISVNEDTRVTYKLCADKEPLIQVTTTLTAAVNREVVAQFEVEQPRVLADVLGGCSFDMFNGVDVVRRRYSRWTPIPGNYYPSLSHVALPALDAGNSSSGWASVRESRYARERLALHSRQPMGATCIRANTLEVMLHRSMSGNDYRGLHEPMVDDVPAAVTHFIDLGLGGGQHGASQSGRRAAAEPVSVLARNGLVNSPALAFVFPLPADAQDRNVHFSGTNAFDAGTRDNALSAGKMRFIGIQVGDMQTRVLETQQQDALPEDDVHIYVRVQALPAEETLVLHAGGAAVDVPIHALLSLPDSHTVKGFVVSGGDWSIAPLSNRNRRELQVDRVVLRPGQQALYHLVASRAQ
ncbi:hypothetical protein GQ54DRAFT_116086 [Martensiomyces pterosporus]|nr:hypothetical protein GQ54DRAFT_116086 [Martensiomyces pterosporus]